MPVCRECAQSTTGFCPDHTRYSLDHLFSGAKPLPGGVDEAAGTVKVALPDKIFDPITKSKHYNSHQSGVECITVARWMSFNLGNVMKYIWRAGIKTEVPLEDLKKARYYLDDEIKRLESTDGK